MLLCYTNHALDQFLSELIARIDTANYNNAKDTLNSGIVRIGGRCKDESLQKYTLRELRSQLRRTRKVPNHIYRGIII